MTFTSCNLRHLLLVRDRILAQMDFGSYSCKLNLVMALGVSSVC